jgi:peptidoglycan hydrolase CwlO-like protein
MNEQTFKSVVLGILLCSGSLFVNSRVVLGEDDSKEEAGSRNFEHLLMLTEKQTAELHGETKRIKKELAEFEARTRELSAQVQSARQKMAQLQKEAETISALLERKSMVDMP